MSLVLNFLTAAGCFLRKMTSVSEERGAWGDEVVMSMIPVFFLGDLRTSLITMSLSRKSLLGVTEAGLLVSITKTAFSSSSTVKSTNLAMARKPGI